MPSTPEFPTDPESKPKPEILIVGAGESVSEITLRALLTHALQTPNAVLVVSQKGNLEEDALKKILENEEILGRVNDPNKPSIFEIMLGEEKSVVIEITDKIPSEHPTLPQEHALCLAEEMKRITKLQQPIKEHKEPSFHNDQPWKKRNRHQDPHHFRKSKPR